MRVKTCKTLLYALLPLVLATASIQRLAAQETQPDQPQVVTSDDAAGQPNAVVRTARLALLSGDLQIQRTDNSAPDRGGDSAALNMPLTEGTRLVTGENGQAEIEFEDGSVARMAARTSLSIDSLALYEKGGAQTQLSVLSGVAYFELRDAPGTSWLLQAGNIALSPAANAVLRVTLNDEGPTFAVLAGSVEVNRDEGFHAIVKAGESLRPDPNDPALYLLNEQISAEPADAWNKSRDELAANDAAARTSARDDFAGTQGYGWSDLDANGNWFNVAADDGSQSEVWQPTVAAADDSGSGDDAGGGDAFDPYGDGAFVWSGQGYEWASSYTWGWLPFRCGRWNWFPGFGWAWQPDRFCSVRGFGEGGILIGRHPQYYRPIQLPPGTPGRRHPIHRVHITSTPSAARPVSTIRGPIRIAGAVVAPMTILVNTTAAPSSTPGQALYRDFPVEPESRKPVLGNIADPVERRADMPVSGWITHQSTVQPVVVARAPSRNTGAPGGGSDARPVARPVTDPQPQPAPQPREALQPKEAPRSAPPPTAAAAPITGKAK